MELLKIRHEFYQKTRDRVEALVGSKGSELKNYTLSYERELAKSRWSASTRKEFFSQLKDVNAVLVGDFHAQPQSARSVLRISRKLGASQIALVLECIPAVYQKELNEYVAGSMSEKDFLKKIEWKKNWGFPWEYMRPLMKWAIVHKVPVYGLNKLDAKVKLKARDEFAADVILKVHKHHPDRTLVVQMGDFHLSSAHLPRHIKRKWPNVKMLTVLQSPESLYFKISKSKINPVPDFIKLSNDRWALMTVLPWVKWQDYLLYLETGSDRRVRVDDVDLTDHVAQAVKLMASSLKIKVDPSELSVYMAKEDQIFNSLNKLDPNVRKKIKEDIMNGQSFFVPEIQQGYLSRMSLNHISRIAAHYILYKMGVYKKTIVDPKKDFLKLIWLEMLTYFFSKLTNPKRKTDTLEDIRLALYKEHFDDRGKEALTLSLEQKLREMRHMNATSGVSVSRDSSIRNKNSYRVASQILGGIMGEKIFYAFHKKYLKLPAQNSFLFKDLHSSLFNVAYYEALETIESWPVAFKSKFDQF